MLFVFLDSFRFGLGPQLHFGLLCKNVFEVVQLIVYVSLVGNTFVAFTCDAWLLETVEPRLFLNSDHVLESTMDVTRYRKLCIC